jgi:hypothetical protein
MPGKAAGLQLETSASDIVEIAALRGRAPTLPGSRSARRGANCRHSAGAGPRPIT